MTVTNEGTETAATLLLVTRFEKGFVLPMNVDALMADMTDDCVFEHVAPTASSLGRHEGQAAVRAVWSSMETHFPGFVMEVDDLFAAGDRAVCRWTMKWKQGDGESTMRGTDVFTLRDGRIAEKLTYATL
jgi:ketosteroid isomerase-like protein